jgi:hypothetical protein
MIPSASIPTGDNVLMDLGTPYRVIGGEDAYP